MKPISRMGKGAFFAPCPRGYDDGGHASLCPPYKSNGIDMISETVYLAPQVFPGSPVRPRHDDDTAASTSCMSGAVALAPNSRHAGSCEPRNQNKLAR
jgi:hypothetical protein